MMLRFYAQDMGTLYYGDNFDILKRYIEDESVDLVYLDPPFNSAQNYNAFFHEKDGTAAASQIHAFEDTWSWNQESQKVYEELVMEPGKVSDVLQAFKTFLGTNDMMAYLAMIAPRLVELRRVLKPTGSLYLHCDSTASHYLKLLCDAVFGPENFRNEIIWKRADTVKGNFGQGSRFFDRNTDSIIFYARTEANKFNPIFKPYSEEYIETSYRHIESKTGRRYQLISMDGPGGAAKGNPSYEVMGITRYWRYSKEKMQQLIDTGLVVQTSPGAVPRRKQYLDEGKGVPAQSLWDDIPALHSQSAERLGYPTQKPVALLERIINASSDKGEVVLDPFCGCGTTIDAAEKLGRKWIGIDITQLATTLIKNRLRDTYGDKVEIQTVGEPTTAGEALKLAEDDKYQFQWWALGLLGARPVEQKKGADHGIDGKLLFRDDPRETRLEQIIIQVKGGHTSVKDVRDLRGVLDREKAAIGVLITIEEPTKPMKEEAASVGFYVHKMNGKKYPRLQLRTIKELMDGKDIEKPSNVAAVDETFKRAQKAKSKDMQRKLFEEE
jgi:DNA modification methylase